MLARPLRICQHPLHDPHERDHAGELLGADKRGRSACKPIDTFCRTVRVVTGAAEAAIWSCSSTLSQQFIGVTRFAAHALALDLTLVTNNTKHFGKVRGLKTANWSGVAG